MPKRTPFVRYKLIIERLQSGRRPSLQDLQRHLEENNYPISTRGILRDIETLNANFDIEIVYVRKGNFYYIEEKSSPGLSAALAYLEMAQAADTFIETFKDLKDLSKYVAFEYQDLVKGTEHLPTLLDAMKSEGTVALWHSTFQDQEVKRYAFSPQLLKQYQGRWYAIGAVSGIDKPMAFGLDRIHRIEAIPGSPRAGRLDLSGYEDVIGVSLPEGEPVEVRFIATSLQARYLEALPLHRSQRVVARKEDGVEFSLRLIPNYELTQELLKLGDSVQVLSPPSLVGKLREILEKSLEKSKIAT
ncbi:MAG TPA: WYL domain-containing protein [Rectinemataceae bacterium]